MNQSTTDDLEGKAHEAKGTVKELAGQLTNNADLEAEGKDEKTAGKVRQKVADIEKVLEK
jgi:uncharacterized protein YjbJ (UPF0337 family)